MWTGRLSFPSCLEMICYTIPHKSLAAEPSTQRKSRDLAGHAAVLKCKIWWLKKTKYKKLPATRETRKAIDLAEMRK